MKMMLPGRVRCVWLSFCMVSAVLLLSADAAQALPRTYDELRAIKDNLTETTVKHGDIPALFNPPTMSINDAANAFDADEIMLLVAFPTGIRMYAQSILVWHEVVNETIKGNSYVVTYSPLSGSFAAYEARVDNTSLIFDAEGRLYNNNSVLIDRNTGSLWLQLPGISFDGPLFGRGLKHIPVIRTDWARARKAFPDAEVVGRPRATQRTYGRDPYGSLKDKTSYHFNEYIYYPLAQGLDIRLSPKTQILGMEKDTLSFAVDINYVKEKGLVNFFLGPYPLLAVYDPAIGAVRIYDRTVWGEPALFRLENGQIVDIDSQSRWNMDGLAVDGNLKGASLEPLFGIYAFWFAWAAFYPDTVIIPGPTVVPDSALIKGKP